MHKLLKGVDSYKESHFKFYPDNMIGMTSYIESRGYSLPFQTEPELVFFGIRNFIKEYLSIPVTMSDVYEFGKLVENHGLPFNWEGWQRIVKNHSGYVPVRIEALPEGTVAPVKVPLVQVTSLDTELPWITSYIETALLRSIWYPTTVATLSREAKKIIQGYLNETAEDENVLFRLHDFGSRGVSSQESAGLGGAAHLINFRGTDTLDALWYVHENYILKDQVAAYSVPATEHSISTAYGKNFENAYALRVIQNLITGDAKIASIVADTYDLDNFVDKILGVEINSLIRSLGTIGKTLVIRPDSGNPGDVTLRTIESLAKNFGYSTNKKGFKVLPTYLRIIQGDGIGLDMIDYILYNFKEHGWSAENITFGMGGNLLQNVNRDTLKFAMKANEVEFFDSATKEKFKVPLSKSPKDDPSKASKAGHQYVYRDDETGKLKSTTDDNIKNEFGIVYSMSYGQGIVDDTDPDFDSIRERAKL